MGKVVNVPSSMYYSIASGNYRIDILSGGFGILCGEKIRQNQKIVVRNSNVRQIGAWVDRDGDKLVLRLMTRGSKSKGER